MSAEGQALQAKYQKLAAEYAKLRAQNTVLKKAVIEEQEKTKSLQETIKQKDQSIRKYEQELDSVQFRNDQLSKRVAVLQEELDESSGKNWKSWASSPSKPPVVNDVKDEELQFKIQENERLQRELSESTQQYRQQLVELQERLAKAERDSSSQQKIIDEASDTHRMVIDKLQEDRALMEAKLRKTEEELRASSLKAEKSQQQLKMVQQEMSSKYDNVCKVLGEKVPFNDTEHKELNIFNIPPHDRRHQAKSRELTALANDLIKELMSALSNLHTYTEQRIKTFYVESEQMQLTASTQKFCGYLHENAAVLRAVEQSFSSFHKNLKTDSLITLETVVGLKHFADAFHDYVNYLKKILPYHKLSMEEDCNSSTCSTTLQGHNHQVFNSLVHFFQVFNKIDSYVSALASASSSLPGLLPVNYSVSFMQLTCFLEELNDAVKELSKHYHSKISIEHQLPTTSQTLKTTDECIMSTFVYLITTTGKIVKFMNNNLDFLTSKSVLRTRGATTATEADLTTSPIVISFRHQAVDYLSKIKAPCPESVPYSLAVHNNKVLAHSSQSKDTLSEQITQNQERMSKLEQAKEHWMLEAQLLQVKYEKESKRAELLEKEVHKLKLMPKLHESEDIKQPSSFSSISERPPTPPTDLGEVLTVTDETSEEQTRENLIKSHFTSRITELSSQLQLVDGKAASFGTECRALYKRANHF
ncbi:protein phosphatase 1 regulatory subunit 21 isoform X2 [Nematostella vectensis]|uniref:protein phosphatase 1 regulatory subunit 21 isoform X2 n=1 Tax=Nematostella vectensis TaxID=45351 RepID=UPI0020773CC8|nr:protein phosphatase 1 regulatory subunit 21 isoform X2 [Nematostella vectensis]